MRIRDHFILRNNWVAKNAITRHYQFFQGKMGVLHAQSRTTSDEIPAGDGGGNTQPIGFGGGGGGVVLPIGGGDDDGDDHYIGGGGGTGGHIGEPIFVEPYRAVLTLDVPGYETQSSLSRRFPANETANTLTITCCGAGPTKIFFYSSIKKNYVLPLHIRDLPEKFKILAAKIPKFTHTTHLVIVFYEWIAIDKIEAY